MRKFRAMSVSHSRSSRKKLDDLQAVQERGGQVLHHVGGGMNITSERSKRDIQVVVYEIAVLFRSRISRRTRGRVALEALADFVDLVQHENRVLTPGAHFIDDAARHGPHVGPPWPRRSASSLRPARDTRTNFRFQGKGDGLAVWRSCRCPGAGKAQHRAPGFWRCAFFSKCF